MYFGPSVDARDANTFSILIQAQFVGQTVWIGTSTTTFQYVDPCLTTTFTTYSYSALTQNLFVTPATHTETQSLWIDEVSTSLSNLLCGPITYTQYVKSAPAGYDNSTSIFTFS